MSNAYNQNKDSDSEEIDLNQIINQYLYYWKWFLISVIIVVFAAFVYLRYATPQYKVDAKILLEKEDKASGELSGLAELSTLTGGSGQSAFVMDQIDVFMSRRLLRKVIDANSLEYSYYLKGNIGQTAILEENSPIKISSSVPSKDNESGVFTIEILGTSNYSLKEEGGIKLDSAEFGKPIKLKYGTLVLTPNPNQDLSKYKGVKVKIAVQSVDEAIDILQKRILITPNKEKQSYIVNFSLTGSNIDKSKMIINSLIDQYNEEVTNDNSKITQSTSRFINSRLELIGQDLDLADKKVQDYKSGHNMIDLGAESTLNLKTLSEADKEVLEKRTQVQLVEYMRESIRNSSDLELLPSNIGLSDLSIERNLTEYNKLVLEREDLLKNATLENPVVKNLTESIKSLNKNLITSLDNYQSVLQLSLKNAESKMNQLERKVSAIPNQEFGFREIARQQQTVESIYLFLLQKREENEIKASATPDILKVIDSAYGSPKPVAPKKMIILLGAFILGLILPFSVLYVKFLLDNKVHSRKDLESFIKAPILVEIPTTDDTNIKDNDRSSLAEAFRILRTNISFMLGARKGSSSVIFVTSTTSGEGKSFVSTNLARILSMSNKRVLLVGADIRSPKVLDYLGLSHLHHTNIGITQYLINPEMDVDSIILKKPAPYKFDIIYSGYIAPNPAELLMNGYFENIIEYGRNNYDYVIVDTAPVSLVTDTLLISEFADLTIYVTRANYLEKHMLNVPKDLYEEGKLKNMALVLNDVDFARGYGYGYGYGYGEHKEDKSFGTRIMKTVKNLFSSKKD